MLDTQRILKDERLLRATTGLNLKAFTALKSSFEAVLLETEDLL